MATKLVATLLAFYLLASAFLPNSAKAYEDATGFSKFRDIPMPVIGTEPALAGTAAREWIQRAGLEAKNIRVWPLPSSLSNVQAGYLNRSLDGRREKMNYEVEAQVSDGSRLKMKVTVEENWDQDQLLYYARKTSKVKNVSLVSANELVTAALVQVPASELSFNQQVRNQAELAQFLDRSQLSMPIKVSLSTGGDRGYGSGNATIELEATPMLKTGKQLQITMTAYQGKKQLWSRKLKSVGVSQPGELEFSSDLNGPLLRIRNEWDSKNNRPRFELEALYTVNGSSTTFGLFNSSVSTSQSSFNAGLCRSLFE